MKQNHTGAKAHTKKTFKTILFSLAVIATVLCSLLQFASCKKQKFTFPQKEVQALKDFYNAMGGENWTTIKWDFSKSEIDEACPGVSFIDGEKNSILVAEINLPNNNLQGVLPASLENLPNLTRLDLRDNKISGSIPTSLGNLTKLVVLNLSKNTIDGSIPASLGNLINLKTFNLSSNELTGSLPEELANLVELNGKSSAEYLRIVEVGNNRLSAPLPQRLETAFSEKKVILSLCPQKQFTNSNDCFISWYGNIVE